MEIEEQILIRVSYYIVTKSGLAETSGEIGVAYQKKVDDEIVSPVIFSIMS